MSKKIVYTDPTFPLDKENIFLSVESYKGKKDFEKKNGTSEFAALLEVDTKDAELKQAIRMVKRMHNMYKRRSPFRSELENFLRKHKAIK